MSLARPTHPLPVLEAGGLLLRPVVEADAPALLAVFGDPEVTRFWSRPPLPGLPAAEALVREIHDHARQGTLFQWAVARADRSELLVGTATLAGLDPEHRRASIGFAVARAAWGGGIGGAAAARVLRHAFESLRLHRVTADADPRNAASIRILRRLGFRHEGRLREHYWQSGEWQDGELFGLLRREWEEGRA